jgi:hypothetical protein
VPYRASYDAPALPIWDTVICVLDPDPDSQLTRLGTPVRISPPDFKIAQEGLHRIGGSCWTVPGQSSLLDSCRRLGLDYTAPQARSAEIACCQRLKYLRLWGSFGCNVQSSVSNGSEKPSCTGWLASITCSIGNRQQQIISPGAAETACQSWQHGGFQNAALAQGRLCRKV